MFNSPELRYVSTKSFTKSPLTWKTMSSSVIDAQLGDFKSIRETSPWKTNGPGPLTGRHNKYSHPGPRYQSLARAL